MYDFLITYIKNHSTTPITDTEIEAIQAAFVPKKIRKRQYFLQEGQVCKNVAFIVKGAMREYYVDDKGVEHITRLLIENCWAVDRESYVMRNPSVYNIDAWEDCDVLLLARDHHLSLLNSIPHYNEAMRRANDTLAIAMQKRVASFSLSAEERYAELIRTQPEILLRFPQHIIASYLGVAKETLSRIRGYVGKK